MPKRSDASTDGGLLPCLVHQRRGPEKPTWRCRDRLWLSFAWLAPSNRGAFNSTHIHGTCVPVEEPSTASTTDSCTATKLGRRTTFVATCWAALGTSKVIPRQALSIWTS